MYRTRIHQEVIYGHFREFMEVAGAFQALMRKRGWAEGTLWTPTAGQGNVVIWDTDYRTLPPVSGARRARFRRRPAIGPLDFGRPGVFGLHVGAGH